VTTNRLTVLVTGANGFIGKNLITVLDEHEFIRVIPFTRLDSIADLPHLVSQADVVYHLAGVNRCLDTGEFDLVNFKLTEAVCQAIEAFHLSSGKSVPLIFTSSTHATLNTAYGISKRNAELLVEDLVLRTSVPCRIFRLPGVFGKWSKPNYNSVVATFCYNIARNIPIQVSDPAKEINLVYIDDVISSLLRFLRLHGHDCNYITVAPEYTCSLSDLASIIQSFRQSRYTLMTPPVGVGFTRALYSTYVSYLPLDEFSYSLASHDDLRGTFVEVLKTENSGQFSYFTANPGVTRGGHYHHTKTEKFLVVQGTAQFRFRNLITNQTISLQTTSGSPTIVDTIPGWVHDVTNIGDDTMIVLLWANELFDNIKPDTFPAN
jgi:UDP-2-acetamido-2,6-beta-L-arabino-hexul-4-ose reductase